MPNNTKAQTISCDVCGRRGAQTKYMTRGYGKGPKLLVIENVPVVVCQSCGESYLDRSDIARAGTHQASSTQLGEAAERSCGEFYLSNAN